VFKIALQVSSGQSKWRSTCGGTKFCGFSASPFSNFSEEVTDAESYIQFNLSDF
jgi:hypothetical protein